MDYSAANVIFTAIAAAAVLLLHRGNMLRLVRGRENRIEVSRRATTHDGPGSPA